MKNFGVCYREFPGFRKHYFKSMYLCSQKSLQSYLQLSQLLASFFPHSLHIPLKQRPDFFCPAYVLKLITQAASKHSVSYGCRSPQYYLRASSLARFLSACILSSSLFACLTCRKSLWWRNSRFQITYFLRVPVAYHSSVYRSLAWNRGFFSQQNLCALCNGENIYPLGIACLPLPQIGPL